MKKAKQRDKRFFSNVILGAVPFMTGFLAATIVQEIVFESKKCKRNAFCDVNFAQNNAERRAKHHKKDDDCEYFSSFDMKVGFGDV